MCRTSAEESSEFSKEQINVNDDDVECKDTISSTRDGCCCKDTSFSSMDLGQDLSDSAVPCSDFSVCDNLRPLQSWDTIYPSKARTMLNASDVSLSNAICTNVEQRVCGKSNVQSNVCENNSAYTVCHAIDGSRWLPKSIYTDCVTYGKVPKERIADDCKYRNKKLQDSILNRNNVWKRQMENKLLQQSSESCHRENAGRRSTCSCIAEEEEDCFNEGKFPESVCNNTKCLEKRSVCRTPSSKLVETATVCEIPFNTIGECIEQTCECMFEDSMECLKGKCNKNVKMLSVCQTSSSKLDENATICESVSFSVARDRFEKMQTCKSTFENPVKCPKDTTMYETTFENSEELTEVTRVCKKFVTEESPKDITVCRRMFGEPKGPPEEVIVGEALPDAEEAPKETICRKISDSNFVNQSNDKRVFLNDAKDNLAKENVNSSNLNKLQKKNNENAKRVIIQLDNNVALNNFTGEKSANDIKQDKQIKETVSNNLSKITTASVEPIKDSFSKPSSKIIYSITLPQTQVYDRPNLVSNLNEKETSNAFVNKRKTTIQLTFNQQMRNNFQQSNEDPMARNSASNKINQSEKKMQEELKEEEKSEDVSKERRTTEEKPRDSFLNRSVKKLTDMIKLGRIKIKERTETGKDIPKKIIADDIKDVGKSDIIFEKDKITMPVRYRFKGRGKV